jgi:hypothetical protein
MERSEIRDLLSRIPLRSMRATALPSHAASVGRTCLAISPPFSRSTIAMSYWFSRSSQNCAALPNWRQSRSAVSAVIERRPFRAVTPAGRHADVERQPVGGKLSRRELALQQAARVCDRSHGHPL